MSSTKRIVIVGGVAGGASAAARCRRLSEEAEIIMFERGPYISFANCGLPYHIGGDIPDRARLLVQTPAQMAARYHIDIRTRCEVTAIDRAAKAVTVRNLDTLQDFTQPYDKLILSPGAEPVRPGIPGASSARVLSLRSLEDMDRIQNALTQYAPRRTVVVGGGYIGLEMTEALSRRNIPVTLVEMAPQVFLAVDPEMAAPIHQQLRSHNVDLRLNTCVTAITERAESLELTLSNGETLSCGFVIMAVGVKPENKLALDAGLALGLRGGIAVDSHMRTSDPDIYAVGDAVEIPHLLTGQPVLLPLAGPANRQGRIAADNALGRDSVYAPAQGTAACKIFELTVAMTGLNETALKRQKLAYEKIYVHPDNHAGYYPGASQINMKLLFDPHTGKILGAQALGADGVDKRIDVLAVALRAGMTVQQLSHLELCYAPPYGSAKDPVNYAGFVASNVISGDMPLCHVADIITPQPDQYLLDVRTPDEFKAGSIPGARHIPLHELRHRLAELPARQEALVFCQVGLRGYLACRILMQNHIPCRNLSGGYKTYQHVLSQTDSVILPLAHQEKGKCCPETSDKADCCR